MPKHLLAAAVLVFVSQPVLDACTTFCVRAGDRVIFGRNYDFEIDRPFETLEDVAQRHTRWSIVYDQTRGAIYWRTDAHAPVRSLRLSSVDFSCASAPLSVDVNAPIAGDVRAHLTPLTLDGNAALIETSTGRTSFTRRPSAEEIASQARYGFSASCAG